MNGPGQRPPSHLLGRYQQKDGGIIRCTPVKLGGRPVDGAEYRLLEAGRSFYFTAQV